MPAYARMYYLGTTDLPERKQFEPGTFFVRRGSAKDEPVFVGEAALKRPELISAGLRMTPPAFCGTSVSTHRPSLWIPFGPENCETPSWL